MVSVTYMMTDLFVKKINTNLSVFLFTEKNKIKVFLHWLGDTPNEKWGIAN